MYKLAWEHRTLKTIQKQETQTTVNNLSLAPKGVERIKHKSLILAQDERWRRA